MTLNEHRIISTDASAQWQCVIRALPKKIWPPGKAAISPNFGAGLVELRFSALKNWFSELNLPGRSFSV